MADLFTLDDYKTFKGIEHFKDDSKISALVSPISELVKTYCGTSFVDYYSSALTEKFDIMDNQTTEVFVTESPLNTVTSVKERSGLGVAYETLTNNEITTSNYSYWDNKLILRLLSKDSYNLKFAIDKILSYFFEGSKIPKVWNI